MFLFCTVISSPIAVISFSMSVRVFRLRTHERKDVVVKVLPFISVGLEEVGSRLHV